MTKEEIEEGRRLLETYQLALDVFRASGSALSHKLTHATEELHPWLFDHADELIALAEEERWKDVAECVPENGTLVLVYDGESVSLAELHPISGVGWGGRMWIAPGGAATSLPTHWRPLPRFGGE